MAFTVNDVRDLIRLLAEHPEWRAELRPLILGDEFVGVPARIAAIDERIAKLDEHIVELRAGMTEQLRATDERITAIDERIAAVEERIMALEERIAEMDARFTARFERLDSRMDRMEGRLGHIYGGQLEERYVRHARDWLKLHVRRPRLVFVDELALIDEARLDTTEYERLLHTDLLALGEARDGSGDVALAGEISSTIETSDVARADASASTLRKAGYRALSLVGGHEITGDAAALAQRLGTIIDLRRHSGTG